MATPLDNYLEQDTSRLQGEIYEIMRNQGRVSALIKKAELPDGMGYNFNSVVYQRSTGVGGNGWVAVVQENGTVNNCVTSASVVSPASTLLSYTAFTTLIKSSPVCFEDYRRGYMFADQVKAIQDNLVAEVTDTWENQDKLQYFTNCGHKIVYNSSLSETTNGAAYPATRATSTINQGLLDQLYTRIVQDGGGKEAYAKRNGAPLITAIMSMERSRDIIKQDPSVRDDFRWADSGKSDGAVLMQSWGVDRVYGGFMHCIDDKMRRFDFVNGNYVERTYYASTPTTIGLEADVNPLYTNAEFEEIFLWHPDVVIRQMPKAIGSVGGMTAGQAVNWSGQLLWKNIPSETENPLSNIGRYYAPLQAAWKPAKTRYGYSIVVLRCSRVATTSCPAY